MKKLALLAALGLVAGAATSVHARAIRQFDIIGRCQIAVNPIGGDAAQFLIQRQVIGGLNACLEKESNGGKYVFAAPAKTAAGAAAIGLYIGGSSSCSDLPYVLEYSVKQNPVGIAGFPLVVFDHSEGHMLCR